MTPLARHCAPAAAGPRVWWQDKPVGEYHPRKEVPVRDTVNAFIVALEHGRSFRTPDILRAHPDLVRHTVVLILADLLKAGAITRIAVGRYVRAT